MKYHLLNHYYDLKLTLPARTCQQGANKHATLTRIENILWVRYGYDIALKHSFKIA